ncbi:MULTISPECIES: spermidine synthase [unclassified Flavobacterium]|uniref:spermidine synthase n=1 Tax=unclassified Flavobacterium TaxID=196869 RepID=UPI001F13C15A|nr:MULTISPECIES: spermidine synthase [unclassified Flavobacterium]UMY65357.1 spermidine synthase [Flavobacterium sp. HJ-32-4]
MSRWKRLLSHFFPLTIHRQASAISGSLEITWANGQLVLDSQNTNYSYGSLQRVLRLGLEDIGFDTIRKMEHILVLGVAGGSVIHTLTEEVGFTGRITGVEIDQEVLQLAERYFDLGRIPTLELVCDDAFEYVLKTKLLYDCIIIDIFRDTDMPNFLFEHFFIQRIGSITKSNGFIMFNTMILTSVDNDRNRAYAPQWGEGFTVKSLPRLEQHNELFVVRKETSGTF